MDDSERLKRGEAARRQVLGDAWVDRSAKNRNAFNAEWLDYHHPQPLVRRLDAAAFRRPHPARPGDRHHARARPLGGIPACMCAPR